MDDQQIIALYWRREESAITETAKKYGGYCHTIARNITGSTQDAEECVSDTWLGAWNAMPPHRPSRLNLFLGKITRSLAADRFRAKNAEKRGGGEIPLALEELRECVPAVTDRQVEDRELAESINAFLHTLPVRDCNLFLRRYWYGESLQTIAGRYGMKLNTVKTNLYRSREKLRRHLEKEGISV